MQLMNVLKAFIQNDVFMSRFTRLRSPTLPLHLAFLFSGNELLSVDSNMSKLGHAEYNCIRRSQHKMHRHKLFHPLRLVVIKLNRAGDLSMSRPCRQCSMFIRQSLPRARVFYSTSNGAIYEDVHMDNEHCTMRTRKGRPFATTSFQCHVSNDDGTTCSGGT